MKAAADPATRRAIAGGSAVLFAITAAHALAETARDTMFLRELPPERLPWAYLGIAAGVLLSSRSIERAVGARSRLHALQVLLGVGAAGHLAFAAVGGGGPAFLTALYVWCGVLATQLLIQLWLVVGGALDVRVAKRLFAWIAAAGLAGAAGGAGLAALLLLRWPVQALLVAAAASLGLAALGSLWLPARPSEAAAGEAPAPWRGVLAEDYSARVVLAVALLAATTVGIDYLFKAAVVEALPRQQLGHFFARFHAGVNAGALALQLVATPWLLQRAGVARSLLALPSLAAVGAGLVAVFGGLWPSLALKASEALLSQSVHRAGSEILFLPVPERLRVGLRSAAAALGQRGGQAAGSVALLGALAAGAGPSLVAAGTAALSTGLFAVIFGLRRRYVDRFRTELRRLVEGPSMDVPRLDLAALECLIAALSSPDADEVIAALDLLESYGKDHLVPPLILYHPEPRVLVRVLELFRDTRDATLRPLVARLGRHADDGVRAAALRCRGDAFEAPVLFRMLHAEPSPAVRAAALAELSRRGEIDPERERAVTNALVAGGPEAVPALARAVAALDPEEVGQWLVELAVHPDAEVRTELAEELARRPAPPHVPALIELLADPGARDPARRALCAIGTPAFEALAAGLRDSARPRAVRRHLPRSISRFAPEQAVPTLVEALPRERDPHVRYKILRGLGRLRADQPGIPVDVGPVLSVAEDSLRRAVELLAFQAALERGANGEALLARLLREEEARALERVFRAFHIVDPEVGYRALSDAVRGDDPRASAAAREVLEHVVKEPLRSGLLPLLSPAPLAERLARALAFHAPAGAEALLESEAPAPAVLDACWDAMTRDDDPVLAAVARRARALRAEDADGGS